MNAPKFKIGDNVVFSREINGNQYVVKGTVYNVDKCGIFEQDEEPTYDVTSVGLDGQECLYIHIRESQCLKCYQYIDTGKSISKIYENTPKFRMGDVVRIRPDLDNYYKRCMRAQHWTSSINAVTTDMLKYQDCVATIEADDTTGYTLDIDGGLFWWPSELLTLVEDKEKIPELEENKTSPTVKTKDNLMGDLWHTMDEEPLESGVILFSDKTNRIYDGSYIGDGRFEINGLVVNKNNFDCWCQRLDFFKKTNLRNYLRMK